MITTWIAVSFQYSRHQAVAETGSSEDSRLKEILSVLTTAVVSGAVEVLETRRTGAVLASYKDAKELVTTADRRSDTAILAVFRMQLAGIDPEIVFHLEESGLSGAPWRKIAGADPLDGTNHFAAGGNLYSVQAHYVEDASRKLVSSFSLRFTSHWTKPITASGGSLSQFAAAGPQERDYRL